MSHLSPTTRPIELYKQPLASATATSATATPTLDTAASATAASATAASATVTSVTAASATIASDTAPQLQPQLNALAVGVDLLGYGDGFCNFTYLVVPSVQNMHLVVDPPSLMHPSMRLIWELPCTTIFHLLAKVHMMRSAS